MKEIPEEIDHYIRGYLNYSQSYYRSPSVYRSVNHIIPLRGLGIRKNLLSEMQKPFPTLMELCIKKIEESMDDNSELRGDLEHLADTVFTDRNIIKSKKIHNFLQNRIADAIARNSAIFTETSQILRDNTPKNLLDKTPIDPYHPGAIIPYNSLQKW